MKVHIDDLEVQIESDDRIMKENTLLKKKIKQLEQTIQEKIDERISFYEAENQKIKESYKEREEKLKIREEDYKNSIKSLTVKIFCLEEQLKNNEEKNKIMDNYTSRDININNRNSMDNSYSPLPRNIQESSKTFSKENVKNIEFKIPKARHRSQVSFIIEESHLGKLPQTARKLIQREHDMLHEKTQNAQNLNKFKKSFLQFGGSSDMNFRKFLLSGNKNVKKNPIKAHSKQVSQLSQNISNNSMLSIR
jgi:hypothetical protein